jgi:hypothetical protein
LRQAYQTVSRDAPRFEQFGEQVTVAATAEIHSRSVRAEAIRATSTS